MGVTATSTPTVKSAMRTLDLIEYVVARPAGVVANEIAEALAIPVSSLSYLLATMVERAYLHREGRRYFAGPGLDRLRRGQEDNSLGDRARPLITALSRRLDETASLFEPDGWELIVTVTETSKQTLRYALDVGTRTPLHGVAAGKSILAALAPEDLDRYLTESRREKFTAATATEPAKLKARLKCIRADGYAITRDEFSIGLSAVGAAILRGTKPIAAVSVAIPTSRFSKSTEVVAIQQVVRTARAIEALIL